jgi:hypothetical protein
MPAINELGYDRRKIIASLTRQIGSALTIMRRCRLTAAQREEYQREIAWCRDQIHRLKKAIREPEPGVATKAGE